MALKVFIAINASDKEQVQIEDIVNTLTPYITGNGDSLGPVFSKSIFESNDAHFGTASSSIAKLFGATTVVPGSSEVDSVLFYGNWVGSPFCRMLHAFCIAYRIPIYTIPKPINRAVPPRI